MITTNKNQEISEVISEALIQVGEKAIIQIEESQTGYTELKTEEGMFLNNGVASSEFLTFSAESNLIYENPLILVVRDPITEISQIVKTMEYIKSIERPLVIFSPEMKKEPLSLLLYNSRKNNINVRKIKKINFSKRFSLKFF
jgi:chaperonin GroEL